MEECPLCGISTINASTRLIKDTCGHMKCRLCLLKEENGCEICKVQTLENSTRTITFIDRFDYPQPGTSTPTHDENIIFASAKIIKNNISYSSKDLNYLYKENVAIDNISNRINFQENAYKRIETRNDNKNNPSNYQYYEEHGTEINNDVELNCYSSVELTQSSQCNSNIESEIENDLSLENRPTIIPINNENTLDFDKVIDGNHKIQTECFESLLKEDKNYEAGFNETKITTFILLSNNSSAITERPTETVTESTVEITELTEHQNADNNNNQLVMYKSPELRLSDYIVFNTQVETVNLINPLITCPAKSLGSISPEFRISDYLLSRQGDNVYSRLIASPTQLISSKSPEINISDYVLLRKIDENVKDNQSMLSPAYSATYASPEFRLSDYLIFKSHGEKNTYAKLIASPIQIDDEQIVDDDNKDYEGDKEKYVESVSAIFKDCLTNKRRNKSIRYPMLTTDKQTIRKKPKFQGKTCKPRKTNKKKSRVSSSSCIETILDKSEDEQVKKPVAKRRKRNTDWSHIIVLPGSPPKYECSKCKKSFANLKNKSYHAACLLGTLFSCDICSKTFKKRSHFEYHITTHTGNKPFKCNICQKSFATNSKLDRHLFIHKPDLEFECDMCGKKLSTKDNLRSHIVLHLKPSFKCNYCPKSFTIKHNLKRHEQNHSSNTKSYICEICSKVFQKEDSLAQHKRRLHSKKKPLNCRKCQRHFLSKFEVDRHMAIHLDEKAFNCEICNLKFRRKDNLTRHVKHHHTDPEYPNEIINGNVTSISVNQSTIDTGLEENSKPKSCKIYVEPIEKNPTSKYRNATPPSSISDSVSEESPKPKGRKRRTKEIEESSTFSPKLKNHTKSAPKTKTVSVIRGPINIKHFPENRKSVRHKLTEPLSLEAALVFNQQIEQKIYTQNSFCYFPGLTRRANSPIRSGSRKRDNFSSNSSSNDGLGYISNESQDSLKYKSREDSFSPQHWRRRTAEVLNAKDKS